MKNLHTERMLAEANLAEEKIHIPTGNVAVFGRSGSGKSTIFYWSQLIKRVICADSGSLGGYRLNNREGLIEITCDGNISPIDQVVENIANYYGLWVMDSWTTLQEMQVAWVKNQNRKKNNRPNAPLI